VVAVTIISALVTAARTLSTASSGKTHRSIASHERTPARELTFGWYLRALVIARTQAIAVRCGACLHSARLCRLPASARASRPWRRPKQRRLRIAVIADAFINARAPRSAAEKAVLRPDARLFLSWGSRKDTDRFQTQRLRRLLIYMPASSPSLRWS